MNTSFLVYFWDSELEVRKSVVCKTKEELSDLLLNLDKRYSLIGEGIHTILGELEEHYSNFLKTKKENK